MPLSQVPTGTCALALPRARMSASTSSAWRVLSLRTAIASRPSWIAKPSHSARVSGGATTNSTTRPRSRGEIRSQKSRARSVNADMVASSHALGNDVEVEPLRRRARAGILVIDVAARDFLEAVDLLERFLDRVDLPEGLREALDVDLLVVDVELLDVDGHLVPRRHVVGDLEQDVVRGQLGPGRQRLGAAADRLVV